MLVDQAFIARRRAKFVLFKNAAAGMVKMVALIALVAFLSAFGVIISLGLAIFVALAVALLWFLPRAQQGYIPIPLVSKKAVKDMTHFSLGNYIYLSVLRVEKNITGVILVSASIACTALGAGYILMNSMGLLGIGVGWIATQTLVAVIAALFLFRRHYHLVSTPPT